MEIIRIFSLTKLMSDEELYIILLSFQKDRLEQSADMHLSVKNSIVKSLFSSLRKMTLKNMYTRGVPEIRGKVP